MHKDVTIYDLARELNLSPATISRGLKKSDAINKDTVSRILSKAEEMGYRHNNFASNLRNKRTQTIGIIVPRLNSYFMTSVLAGIEDVASKERYNIIISQSLEKKELEKSNVNTMFNKRVDGLLISLAYDTTDISHLQPFFDKHIPVVFFDRTFQTEESTCVVINNRDAAYKAVTHLIQQGCKRIMHLGGSLLRDTYSDRLKGYRQALEDNNIYYDDTLVQISKLGEQDGIDAANYILSLNKSERPDAVFCANDMSAVYCMSHLKEQGIKIPDDIAFAGFNNDAVSRVIEPKLTTIDYPGYNIGEAAAAGLLNILKGDVTTMKTTRLVLQSTLLIRDSSKRRL
ncbi:LacI family DNA-binding transcriptional regulator [Lacibacter sp.]|uniref:LacI family DNA-binding transcriptional regulator n=1 Tax=Lacibacter sp. TaxID=1915409 RepID=UPI002B4B39A7|nr:LacI family DNA-binding transcriptional regulator [Lacibacter sp.]HLP39208.1 LacI family DNA-binding transcriptional regulator [Lacibacter sp.]